MFTLLIGSYSILTDSQMRIAKLNVPLRRTSASNLLEIKLPFLYSEYEGFTL